MYKCKCCHSTTFKYLFPGKDRLHGIPGEFSIEECMNCGVIAVHPCLTLNEVEQYYPPDYISYPIAVEDERSWFRRFDRKFGVKKRCDAIVKRAEKKTGRILDLGCATGTFLNGMKQRGWECYGIEPSDFAAHYAQDRFSLNIYHGYLEEGLFPDDYFDIITLWDVMEHLPEPLETLQIISHILKPDGLLVITTPNANAWERNSFGPYWAGWDVPRHYNIFSDETITTLLEKSSFTVNNITSFTGMHGGLVISIQFSIREKNWPDGFKKVLVTLAKSIPFRILMYPYFAIANGKNRSSSMTVFANNKGI